MYIPNEEEEPVQQLSPRRDQSGRLVIASGEDADIREEEEELV
jgi:hypothetical protein